MNIVHLVKLRAAIILWLGLLLAFSAVAQDALPATSSSSAVSTDDPDPWDRDNDADELVAMGHDATLAKGGRAQMVVSIMGSATTAGEVEREVVAVLGNTRVTGPVGGNVVAVLGNTYVNSKVDEQVVAVFGNVELGPQAVINGQVVAVGGEVIRDPAAIVRGDVKNLAMGFTLGNFAWLQPWIDHCFKLGRLLALQPGLTWAWAVAILSLLSYVLTAWLAPRSVERCVLALENHPGPSLLAALSGAVLGPVLIVLLVVTVIGILAVPLVGIALLCIDMFGRLAMLAWLGRRVLRAPDNAFTTHVAMLTLVGGVLVTLLYLIPMIGFIVYKVIGFVGFGAALYALLLNIRSRRQQAAVEMSSLL